MAVHIVPMSQFDRSHVLIMYLLGLVGHKLSGKLSSSLLSRIFSTPNWRKLRRLDKWYYISYVNLICSTNLSILATDLWELFISSIFSGMLFKHKFPESVSRKDAIAILKTFHEVCRLVGQIGNYVKDVLINAKKWYIPDDPIDRVWRPKKAFDILNMMI